MDAIINAIQSASTLAIDAYNNIVMSNPAISFIVLILYVALTAGMIIDSIIGTNE